MVILLPGITGSVLQKDGKDIWAVSGQAASRAFATLGGSLKDLQLVDNNPAGVVATQVMPDAHLVPGLVKIDGYSVIARMIKETFEVIEGSVDVTKAANFIPFPYDWRLDNRAHARRLAELIPRRLHLWRKHTDDPEARVILVAHSMGGLIARYYLEVLDGWSSAKALITFGTTYRGSLNALNFLANGYKSFLLDLTAAMRSFPSVYQLLPIYKALRVGGAFLRVAEGEDIPGVSPSLASDALAFHREIEVKVDEHRKSSDYRGKGYAIIPVVGTKQPTLQSAELANGKVIVSSDLPSGIDPLLADGDGTVPYASAVPIEMSTAYRESFVAERHGSLQCHPSVLNDLMNRLSQMQVRGLAEIRAPEASPAASERPALAVELDDLYVAGEPVTFRARLINAPTSVGPLRADVKPVDGPMQTELPSREFLDTPEGLTLVLDGLSAGLYRVQVRSAKGGPFAPLPVHDLFEVGR
jgi:hypothetical protein